MGREKASQAARHCGSVSIGIGR